MARITDAQKRELKMLGYKGMTTYLTQTQASQIIDRLKEEKSGFHPRKS